MKASGTAAITAATPACDLALADIGGAPPLRAARARAIRAGGRLLGSLHRSRHRKRGSLPYLPKRAAPAPKLRAVIDAAAAPGSGCADRLCGYGTVFATESKSFKIIASNVVLQRQTD